MLKALPTTRSFIYQRGTPMASCPDGISSSKAVAGRETRQPNSPPDCA